MSDQLRLTGLRAFGHHGVFEHERENGQPFVIDVVAHLEAHDAAASDDIGDTVHYGVLAERIVHAVESDPVDLIETVAERVATLVLEDDRVSSAEVTVHKPEAPITVPFDDVSITIRRGRA